MHDFLVSIIPLGTENLLQDSFDGIVVTHVSFRWSSGSFNDSDMADGMVTTSSILCDC